MPSLILVMVGGAAGSALRYQAGRLALHHIGPGFPWGTLFVNLMGGLAIGILGAALLANGPPDRPLWLLIGVGFLGGFTTFSAFSLDVFAMLQRGEIAIAALYVAGSTIGSVLLVFLGYWLAKAAA